MNHHRQCKSGACHPDCLIGAGLFPERELEEKLADWLSRDPEAAMEAIDRVLVKAAEAKASLSD